MKLGPIDFKQPSTWRGLAGLAAVFGFAVSPELTDQIAIGLAAILSAIEIGRNEYASRNAVLRKVETIELQSRAVGTVSDDRLRDAMPAEDDATAEFPPPPGYSNR